MRSASPALARDVLEGAVAAISIECVRLAELAVGEVEVGPAVAVEVGDADRCAERRDVRLDVGDLGVEARPVVHEVNPGRGGLVAKREAGVRDISRCPRWRRIHPNRRDDCREEWNGDNDPSEPLMARRARRLIRMHHQYADPTRRTRQVLSSMVKSFQMGSDSIFLTESDPVKKMESDPIGGFLTPCAVICAE